MSQHQQRKFQPPLDAAYLLRAAAIIHRLETDPASYAQARTLDDARVAICYFKTRAEHFEELARMKTSARPAAKPWLTTMQAVKYAKDRGVLCTTQAIRDWCDRYAIGEKVDGDYRVIMELFDAFLRDRPQRKR
jgi:hypothetical protein